MSHTLSGSAATKRPASELDSKDEDGSSRSRRRAFSCVSCQRLKCRCDYDYTLQSCTRCHLSRIKCSRTDIPPKVQLNDQITEAKFADLEKKLKEHDQALANITKLVETLKAEKQLAVLSSRLSEDIRKQIEQPLSLLPVSISRKPRHALSAHQYTKDDPEPPPTTKTAPLSILRDIGTQFPRPVKKIHQPVLVKLITEDLLNPSLVQQLKKAFLDSNYNSLLLPKISNLEWTDDDLNGLPFLHAVCCLHAIADRQDLAQGTLRRKIYDCIRASLGLVLLDHSLSLNDIQGVLMCTDSFRAGAGGGMEFIDSWTVTGYCAKQAMLRIDFEQIAREVRQSGANLANVRAIQLWASICLHHLHWAAASGRPSTIFDTYLNHCSMLLDFYDASVQDGILLAEVALYSTFMVVSEKGLNLDANHDCDDFAGWRDEWRHLLALPAASLLKMGYASACLLLTVRGLEQQGERLGSAVFLTTQVPSSATLQHDNPVGSGRKGIGNANLRQAAAKHARTLLQIFLQMPVALQDSISSNRCLCLTYAALVLAHYGEAQSRLSDTENLELINQLHGWFTASPSKVVLAKYTVLCEQIILSRLRGSNRGGQGESGVRAGRDRGYSLPEARPGPIAVLPMQDSQAYPVTSSISIQGAVEGHPGDLGHTDFTLFDMLPHINLEDFFTGGYLDI